MTVREAIETRRSIRKYKDTPVEPEKLARVLEAGRLAPSARNLQDWQFIAVTDKELIAKLQVACMNQKQVGMAPVVLVVAATADGALPNGRSKADVDCSIAMTQMMLAAWEEGLGTCWLAGYSDEGVKEVLGLGDGIRTVAVTPLGYPDEEPAAKPRKATEEVVVLR